MPLTILSMVTVPHIMVRLERMLHYRGVGLERFHCMYYTCTLHNIISVVIVTGLNCKRHPGDSAVHLFTLRT